MTTLQNEVPGGYAAVLMIAGADAPLKDVPDIVAWHQEVGVWLSSRKVQKLHEGMPVVARVAGESNELVMFGVISGGWGPNEDAERRDRWPWEIPVAWEFHAHRGVKAVDVLGAHGKARPAAMTISRSAWARVFQALVG